MAEHTPGYEITRDGRIFSLSSNWRGYGSREMAQRPNQYGYLYVRLTIDGRRKVYLVHKLVAAKFLPPRPSLVHEIRHLNGNRQGNRDDNLAWARGNRMPKIASAMAARHAGKSTAPLSAQADRPKE